MDSDISSRDDESYNNAGSVLHRSIRTKVYFGTEAHNLDGQWLQIIHKLPNDYFKRWKQL